MWLNDTSRLKLPENVELDSSISSGEEIPVWVRSEQRWVSGITEDTTCFDVIQVLLKDEERRGRHILLPEQYQITERWRGVEQTLEPYSPLLDIWNTWGSAQTEVKLSLRRIKNDRSSSRRTRCRSDTSSYSDRSAWKTVHPKRLHALQNGKEPSSTEELLKLVLAQGEVIRRQLKKLRHSEYQIGYLEDKTHRARVRKHGSNYLLETYLKGLPEAVDPESDHNGTADKNSDSGVMTEGDSEQSNATNKASRSVEAPIDRFSPSSEEYNKDIQDDDCSSTLSESVLREQAELLDKIVRINKTLLREEQNLVKLDSNIRKYDRNKPQETPDSAESEGVGKTLTKLRADMAKSACEMQHNEIVLEETLEQLERRRKHLEVLLRDLASEDHEYEMLQALLYSSVQQVNKQMSYNNCYHTKELLDTLV